MQSARVVSFSDVCRMADIRDEEGVLEAIAALRHCAHLVRGNWVCRSQGLYTGRALHAREYLVALFATTGEAEDFSCAELSSLLRLDLDTTRALYRELGVVDERTRRLQFRFGYDHQFMELIGSVTPPQKLAEMHESMQQILTRQRNVLQSKLTKAAMRAPASSGMAAAVEPRVDLSQATRQAIRNFVQSQWRNYGVCSLDFIKRRLQAEVVNAGPHGAANHLARWTPELLQELLEQEGMMINGVYARLSLNNPNVDMFRKVVADLFAEKRTLRKTDIKAEVARVLDGAAIPDQVYAKIMRESAESTNRKGEWTLKSGAYDG